MLISIPLLQLIESSTCMSIHVKDALFISLSVWVDNCHLTSNGFSTQFVAFVFWTSRSISRCSQIHVPSLAEITVFRLKSPEIKKKLAHLYWSSHWTTGIASVPNLEALEQRHQDKMFEAICYCACLCLMYLPIVGWFLHASKNGSWTIHWAFSMGLFFHGPPPLGHILRTFNPSRSNGNSFLWGHQRLLEVAGSNQALENITPSWLPFPPVKVPILQGRL